MLITREGEGKQLKKTMSVLIIAVLLIGILSLSFKVKAMKIEPITLAGIASLPPIDWAHYHNYTEIVTILLALNETYPNIVDVFSIGKSWQNRDIYCVRLTNESDPISKPEVFFVGYHHAREQITSELNLYFVVYAATNYGTNATITELINKSEIYVVIALNVDGFDLFKANDYQRKNARPTDEDNDGRIDEDPPEDEDGDGFIEQLINVTDPSNPELIRWEGWDNDHDGRQSEDWIGGVDLNRNYDFHWQASPNKRMETYSGPAPFSEPETRAVRDLVQTHNFKYAVDFHSGTEMILYPWGYTTDPPPDRAKFIEIASNLSSLTGGTPYNQSINLYSTHGTSDDWMYGAEGVLALSCEIFANGTWEGVSHLGPYPNTVWSGGERYWFNPFPKNIESVTLRWLPTFFYLINRAINENFHDVSITQIISDKTIVGEGYPARLNVSMSNIGTFPEIFNVTVYANTTILSKFVDIHLQSGTSTTLLITWNTTGFSRGNYTISANATQVLGETHVADNTYTYGVVKVTISGDINGDFQVNIQDASLLGVYWQKKVPPAPANADINGDGVINIRDATIIGVNWQKP